jgi:hypothetical protein
LSFVDRDSLFVRGPGIEDRRVKVIPLAAESLGVRSMATYVEVGRTGILIDLVRRWRRRGSGCHRRKKSGRRCGRANDRISAYAARAGFVFVSHYHEDHFRSDPASYAGRRVLLKDPRRMIAGRQARRADELWTALDGQARVESADGLQRRESDLELCVSPPLPHGPDGSPFGSVVVLTIVDRPSASASCSPRISRGRRPPSRRRTWCNSGRRSSTSPGQCPTWSARSDARRSSAPSTSSRGSSRRPDVA